MAGIVEHILCAAINIWEALINPSGIYPGLRLWTGCYGQEVLYAARGHAYRTRAGGGAGPPGLKIHDWRYSQVIRAAPSCAVRQP